MYFLPKAVGLHKAKELMFTGDMLSAGDAQKLGMVNRLYNNEELVVKTEEMALRLASCPPLSIELSKATLNRTDLELDDVLAVEASVQTLLLGTKDCAEGITAFKEKRNPVFLGC